MLLSDRQIIYWGCFLDRRCCSIAGLFRSLWLSVVCLPRCALWPNGARYAYIVYRSQIGMWGRDFDWHLFRSPRSTIIPQIGGRIGGSQNSIINCGQTVADWATLWIDRRREVIVVTTAPKHFQLIRITVWRLKKLASTSAALVPQHVGFSCSLLHDSKTRRLISIVHKVPNYLGKALERNNVGGGPPKFETFSSYWNRLIAARRSDSL